jgi:hypothetical protein
MFLSNIQRRNKVLDETGVRPSPKGVQLLKSDVLPRSAKKKLDVPLADADVERVGGLGQKSDSGNSLAFHLIGEGTSRADNGVRKVMSSLERHEELVAAKESVAASSTVSVVSDVSEVPVRKENLIVSSSVSEPVSIASSISAASPSISSSSSGMASVVDSRLSAILQNFQNNGSVQIHLHFHGNN